MKRYFTSIEEQINILEKRGLYIPDKKFAKDTLLRYNYYKIINGTRDIFIIDEKNNRYREGTEFSDLIDIHNFDKDLKKHLLSETLELERIARSIISYKFVEKYPEKNSYLNPNNFNKSEKDLVLVNIDSITETIDRYRNEENYKRSINYYFNKYDSVPFWFVINFVTFGKLINIYETLDLDLQESIADEFQKIIEENLGEKLNEFLTPSILKSFLSSAKDIRNIAAHDNLILDYRYEDIEYFEPIHLKYGIKKNNKLDRLYHAMVCIRAMLPCNYFDKSKNEINHLFEKLKTEVDYIAYDRVKKSLAYKEDNE